MKKIITLFTLILLASCSSEDEVLTDSQKLVGTWKPQSPIKNNECSLDSRYTFNSDNTYTVTSVFLLSRDDKNCTSRKDIGTWKLEGSLLTVNDREDDNPLNIRFIDDNTIRVTNDTSNGLSSALNQTIIRE